MSMPVPSISPVGLTTRTYALKTKWLTSLSLNQSRRHSTQRPNCTATLTEDQTVGIVDFHLSVLKPLLRTYTGWALANLANETEVP